VQRAPPEHTHEAPYEPCPRGTAINPKTLNPITTTWMASGVSARIVREDGQSAQKSSTAVIGRGVRAGRVSPSDESLLQREQG
jgi:hypothetical protein